MTGPTEAEFDVLLSDLLGAPDRPGDRGFMLRVDHAIDAEAALTRAEGRFLRSFAFEAAAVVALLAALWLLSSSPLIAPLAGPGQWGLAPPLLLVVALWFAGTQRLRQT